MTTYAVHVSVMWMSMMHASRYDVSHSDQSPLACSAVRVCHSAACAW